jgi:hypothetical protein
VNASFWRCVVNGIKQVGGWGEWTRTSNVRIPYFKPRKTHFSLCVLTPETQIVEGSVSDLANYRVGLITCRVLRGGQYGSLMWIIPADISCFEITQYKKHLTLRIELEMYWGKARTCTAGYQAKCFLFTSDFYWQWKSKPTAMKRYEDLRGQWVSFWIPTARNLNTKLTRRVLGSAKVACLCTKIWITFNRRKLTQSTCSKQLMKRRDTGVLNCSQLHCTRTSPHLWRSNRSIYTLLLQKSCWNLTVCFILFNIFNVLQF